MDTRTFLQNALAGAVSYLTETRRFLHGIPELGFELYKTAAFVESELISWGYDPQTGIAKTGIIADLQFGRPGPCLMIRADMDGLPIEEATGLPYASEHPGCMHACGHDGHTAMVLGAAKIMSALAASPLGQELAGSIRFLFQPAEEAP
ncbi:MAG: M20/M25/M40 family metallo-hydrolase, partial [Desulfovibrionaceae bacterium]|nr:M20/M25/M40 family metallo-hydrolase [Desulfovibrionaceae bacterium]